MLAIFFYGFGFDLPKPAELLGQIKGKASELVFPKSDREILIEDIQKEYSSLGKFFNSNIPTKLLNSSALSTEQKEILRKAIENFEASKENITEVAEIIKEEKSLPKAFFEKILSPLSQSSKKSDPKNEAGLEPTYIPPQCRVTCPAE